MEFFTEMNTDGYTNADRTELNRRYEAAIEAEAGMSAGDNIAERVQAAFDAELRLHLLAAA